MNAPEDPRIWQGVRTHLDELGSLPTVPPLGSILDRRRSNRPLRAVAGLAGAGAIVLAIGLLLPALRSVTAPIIGASPRPSSASATPSTLPTAGPADLAELVGHAYVATDVTEHGQSFALVPETRLRIRFDDALRFGANAGCNGIGGNYQIRDGRLVIANELTTLIGCPDARARQDGWYYTFLGSSPTISLDTTNLVLTSGDTVVTYVAE